MFYESEFRHHLRSVGISEGTIRIYGQMLKRLEAFARVHGIGDVRTVTEADINAFVLELRSEDLARETEYRVLCHLKRYFDFLETAGFLYLSPAATLRLPKYLRNHHRAYAEEEVREILDGIRTDTPLTLRGKAILELGYSSALRPREIRSLKLADIDWACSQLFIEQSKGKKDRVVPVGSTAIAWIGEYVERMRPRFANQNSGDAVFIGHKSGRPLSERGLDWATREALRQSDLSPFPLYSLRATAATNLLDRGMNVTYIGRLLGHMTIRTTQMYLHTKHRELTRAIRRAHPRYHKTESEEADHET